MKLTASSTGEEIEPLALAIHRLVNELPLTMRTKNSKGLRLEDGEVVEYDYTGPVLEKVIEKVRRSVKYPKPGHTKEHLYRWSHLLRKMK